MRLSWYAEPSSRPRRRRVGERSRSAIISSTLSWLTDRRAEQRTGRAAAVGVGDGVLAVERDPDLQLGHVEADRPRTARSSPAPTTAATRTSRCSRRSSRGARRRRARCRPSRTRCSCRLLTPPLALSQIGGTVTWSCRPWACGACRRAPGRTATQFSRSASHVRPAVGEREALVVEVDPGEVVAGSTTRLTNASACCERGDRILPASGEHALARAVTDRRDDRHGVPRPPAALDGAPCWRRCHRRGSRWARSCRAWYQNGRDLLEQVDVGGERCPLVHLVAVVRPPRRQASPVRPTVSLDRPRHRPGTTSKRSDGDEADRAGQTCANRSAAPPASAEP